MGQPSILVIDGNRAATRAQQVAAGGEPSGEGYAQVLQSLAAVSCDIVRPADGEVRFASGAGLASYDGVAITGSALNVYDGGAHIERQIELARATFAAGVPFFGSCWGLQVAVSAAGGRVRRNPLGREFGFARRIELADAGRRHGMFTGKPPVFEAITVHRDDIEQLPAGAVVLASNDMGLQAIELPHGAGTLTADQRKLAHDAGHRAALHCRADRRAAVRRSRGAGSVCQRSAHTHARSPRPAPDLEARSWRGRAGGLMQACGAAQLARAAGVAVRAAAPLNRRAA